MSLTQLVAVSPMDSFLYCEADKTSSKPRCMSSFKTRFVSKTPFSTEMIRMDFTSYSTPGKGSITIPRKADMLMGIYLEVQFKLSNFANTFFPIENLVENVKLYIGGQLIEMYDNTWIRIRNTVLTDNTEKDSIYAMENFNTSDPVGFVKTLWMKLPFWFEETSKALPLVALQYHDVRLDFTFVNPSSIPGIDSTYAPTITAWGEYVFLAPPERKWFAETSHMYIIEQTQTQSFPSVISTTTTASSSYTLPFNLPTRYIFWVFRNNVFGVFTGDGQGLSASENSAPLLSGKIQINGIDRFQEQRGSYFRLIETNRTMKSVPAAGIYTYFFSKNPKDTNSSMGSLNFSAIDTVKLILTTKIANASSLSSVMNESMTTTSTANLNTLTVIAKSLNVLRVQDGQGGILFAN